ncbi:MAG: chromosome segregation protein SMC [Nitrososphaerota archaeon]|nr:chromosome segregation protein SMC [Nitrososphaerota archaeon]MDG6927329.1 chromosome segregation protein SMC [Nitrososphaerota archaeon]MDG6930943.1 chromosome segregation protein SMC [Nitrososphaerota archaeon]MDG6932243.1 chromosome segregation protein SMC [Nitrososphaerota archaeon]MDG6935764.1 chromosome segregation protein SMC [Nitrososphaerota archaeon]
MVYISKLEIRGFKSFEKNVTIELARGFNAVSGQNGSGKSNIIDAIRFVLGENSPKSLRESKMSSLINEKAKIKQGRVSIQIVNDNHALPVQEETVNITRELFEDGSQKYFLNGKRSTRNAIIDLLLSARISFDGINIVPQGALNRIAETTPAERRAILEDIVGIKAYDDRKGEAVQRLREADSQLAVIFAKLDERRESMIKLERERNDQLRYESLQRELQRYRKSMIADKIGNKTNELESFKKEESKLLEENGRLEAEIQRLLSAGTLTMDQETEAKITELSNARASYDSQESERSFIARRLLQVKDEKSRVQNVISNLNLMKNQLQAEREKASGEKEGMDRQQAELSKEIERKEKELHSINTEYEKNRARRTDLQKEQEKMLGLLGKVRERKEEISSKLAKMGDSLKDEQEKMDQLIKNIESVTGVQSELESGINALKGVSSEESEKVAELLARLQKLSTFREAVADGLREANEVILKSIKEVSVEEAFNRLTSKMSPDAAEELFDSGVFRGYLGRIGDLIHAKQGYKAQVSAAIEALGNPFVFESFDQNLENAMKSLPRSRILLLSMFSGSKACEDSIVGVMEFGKKMEPMVTTLFGNVCIKESACCSSWIREDGAIFGRGMVELGYITSLKLSDKLSAHRLREIRKTINRLSAVVKEKNGVLKKLMVEIHQINSELGNRSINRDVSKKQAEALYRISQMESRIVDGLSKRLESMKTGIEEKRKKTEKLAQALSSLTSKQQEMESKLNQISLEIKATDPGVLEDKIRSVQGEIMGMNQDLMKLSGKGMELGAKIEEIRARLGVTQESLNQQEQRIKELSSEELEATQRITAIEAAKKELETRIQALERELTSTRELMKQKSSDAKSAEDARSEVLRKLKENERKLSKARSVIERNTEDLQRLNAEYQSISVEQYDLYGDYEQVVTELQAELNDLQLRLNRMAVHDYKEYYTSYKDSSVRRNELERDRESIVNFIEEIDRQKREVFIKAFEKIDRELRSVFRELADGEAWLELEYPDNPFSGGVFMLGKFGDKMPRESASLSGGEKAVISVAFLMALQSAYTSPFYLFDEIDANMDAEKAERLGEFLNKWGEASQIILISLRDTVLSKAHNIIGVYEKEGSSYIARLNMERIVDGGGKRQSSQNSA